MFDRVINKRKFVILRESGQPDREFRKIRSHFVSVDAVQTLLSDEAPCVRDSVLIGGETRRGPVSFPRDR